MKIIFDFFRTFVWYLMFSLVFVFQLKVLAQVSQNVANGLYITHKKSNPSYQPLNKYKFVFPTGFLGKKNVVGEQEESKQRSERLKNFVSQMNILGEQGYRIFSSYSQMPYVIAKLDEGEYEYSWFETNSTYFFSKNDFDEKQLEMAKNGFRVIAHFFIGKLCKDIDSEYNTASENCEYKDLFILEKAKDGKKKIEQTRVYSIPSWVGSRSILEEKVLEMINESYYPTLALSPYEVLLEKAEDANEILSDKPEIKIVTSWWGRGSIETKVNELGKQGFRVGKTQNGIIIMYRNSQTAQTPVSYIWINADKKSFSKEIINIQSRGAVYRSSYTNDKGTKNTLIFELSSENKKNQAEFKILNFKFQYSENNTENKVYLEFTSEPSESISLLNKLVEDGFEVRDIFYSGSVSIILEKIK